MPTIKLTRVIKRSPSSSKNPETILDHAIADALRKAQEAVAKAEAAAALDIGTGEVTALLGTAQATDAYQLVIQILQNKEVDLAPALIAVEIAAISEGIAAYLAEQELSMLTERNLEAKALSAFEKVQVEFAERENAAF